MDRLFNKNNSVNSDECWKLSKDSYNDQINQYYLNPVDDTKCNAPNVRMPDFYLDHVNLIGRPGYGIVDPCVVDEYNKMVKNDQLITHDKCKNQVFQRLFQACPAIRGSEGDINKELDIISGTDTNPYNSKKTIMEMQTRKPEPLLDYIKEVQNPDHIVPIWVNGGEDTRSYINRLNFNKKC
jgi:hypothetical protein